MEDTKQTNQQAPAAVGITRVEDRGNGFAVRVGRGIVGVWPTEGEAIDAKLCVDEAYAARQVAAAGPVVEVEESTVFIGQWRVVIAGIGVSLHPSRPEAELLANRLRQALAAPPQPEGEPQPADPADAILRWGADLCDMYREYRDQHDCDHEDARAKAIDEMIEGLWAMAEANGNPAKPERVVVRVRARATDVHVRAGDREMWIDSSHDRTVSQTAAGIAQLFRAAGAAVEMEGGE